MTLWPLSSRRLRVYWLTNLPLTICYRKFLFFRQISTHVSLPNGAKIMKAMKLALARWLSGKESACECRRHRFDPWVSKIPWRKKWQTTPVFLPKEPHGQRNLVGYSPWGHRRVEWACNRTQLQHQLTLGHNNVFWLLLSSPQHEKITAPKTHSTHL